MRLYCVADLRGGSQSTETITGMSHAAPRAVQYEMKGGKVQWSSSNFFESLRLIIEGERAVDAEPLPAEVRTACPLARLLPSCCWGPCHSSAPPACLVPMCHSPPCCRLCRGCFTAVSP